MTIYIDDDYKCHVTDDGTMTAVETDVFDNKCTNLIESYRYVPAGEIWTREDGVEFTWMIAPWRDIRQYDDEQQQYLLDKLTAARAESADMQAALAVLGVTDETEETA
nr:MAG TPA: hypothetical protein [Caudoviricetes sp.]